MQLTEFNNNITVSICLITYNQENIISDVLEYLLAQKTNFKYELVIGEDCSQDKTRAICKTYRKKYPNRIKLILNEKNLGLIENFINTISQCSGKYIAICAGDDFWIDPYKLQKQVDFLENNRDFTMCSCEAYYTSVNFKKNLRAFIGILYNNTIQGSIFTFFKLLFEYILKNEVFWNKRRLPPSVNRPKIGDINTVLRDLQKARYYPASANIYRREVLEEIPLEAYKYKAEHIILILWSALLGKIKLLPEVMVTKNALSTSVTLTKEIHNSYHPDDNIKNYTKLLTLAKKKCYNSKDAQLIENKIYSLNS